MKLYLVQHGEALAKEVDPDRPLSDRGRGDVERLAAFLKGAGVGAARVVHSGKTRARQTAEILAAAVQPAGAAEAMAGMAPKDEVMPFAEAVSEWDGDAVVVGHLPFMARAVCLLLTGNEEHAAVDFRPGSLVCIEREGDGPWGLAWMVRPEMLPA